MDDLDQMLARLRNAPLPAALATIDSAVMEELARIRAAPALRAGTFGAVAVIALVFGIAGSVVQTDRGAATTLSPFDARLALAPSTLLSGE
ncbi:hypothetical protein CA262_06030 [Sphingobium sp. GW456-12-10-14-TSB1]|jgi:hypothetical protein|uniref:Dihydroorotate dehydrogenase n=1 Tax=Novosphingobium soli TaxID=574956 RepID=A0ABV6CRB7_9SPHN|nr:hypothetical protein [Sphingobium sp. GW456-12-10-14-TSB1]OUC54473.1 hypothetical protein CA262_06030 [Sphingobium sp. GW456-12-10-14-TSB1]